MDVKLTRVLWIFLAFQIFVVKCEDSGIPSGAVCRIQGIPNPLELDEFKQASCAICYLIITRQSSSLTTYKFKDFNDSSNSLTDYKNESHIADPDDNDGVVYNSFRWPRTRTQWQDCCSQAVDCCKTMSQTVQTMEEEPTKSSASQTCSPHWSFYHCWPTVKLGKSHKADCPDYAYAYLPKPPCFRYSRTMCYENETTENDSNCNSLEFHRRPASNVSTDEVPAADDGPCCRTIRGHLSLEAYRMETCARCYSAVLGIVKTKRYRYDRNLGLLIDTEDKNKMVIAKVDNQQIVDSLVGSQTARKWKECCQKAMDCCHTMTTESNYTGDGLFCPRTWDGWQCFRDTTAGQMTYNSCPDHVYYAHTVVPQCRGQVQRTCLQDGEWLRSMNSEGLNEISYYRSCASTQDRSKQEYFYFGCFVVTLVSLIPALIIFCSYRKLRETQRIQIHASFFLALTLNAMFLIISHANNIFPDMTSATKTKPSPLDINGPGCKLLQVLSYYCRTCTYTWMLCEGFYLHKHILFAFQREKNLIKYYIFGWGFPLLPTIIFSILMKIKSDVMCWAAPPSSIFWCYRSVFIACIVLNLIFLCNIIRELVSKIRTLQSNEPKYYRAAVKATVVLIPLFGTQFVLSTAYTDESESISCIGSTVYAYFNDTIDGLQGFGVAILYCYMNREVIDVLKRSYEKFRIRHGFQPKPRSRWSMSTQMSNAVEPHNPQQPHKDSIPMSVRKSPESNGSVAARSSTVANGDVTNLSQETETNIANTKPEFEYDNHGFGYDNVHLSKEKVTEL